MENVLTVPDCNSTHIKPNSLDISGGSSGTMTGMVDPPVPVKRKALSYSEALQRAMTGDVGDNILEVLRFEHAQAQLDIAQQDLLVEIKINLGVALLLRGGTYRMHQTALHIMSRRWSSSQQCWRCNQAILRPPATSKLHEGTSCCGQTSSLQTHSTPNLKAWQSLFCLLRFAFSMRTVTVWVRH